MEICLSGSLNKSEELDSNVNFWFDMEDYSSLGMGESKRDEMVVKFELPKQLCLMTLLGAANWNNVEVGALMKIYRCPDKYETDIYQLMSFFCL